jgi:TolB-like protein/Tfp pilus assembly protein PilF
VAIEELKEELDSGKLAMAATTVSVQRRNWVVAGLSAASLLLIMIALVAYNRNSKGLEHGGATGVMSLLVVPLENLSNDPAQQYFADGMTEELINRLGRIRALRVISLTSAMTYKGAKKPLPQIAQELKIDSAVEGSVMHSGDRVRITVQLLDAKTDRHLWDDTYERDLRDILSLQSELASSIAREVQVKLTPQEKRRLASAHPVNPAAYEEYTNGRYHWNKRTPAVELKRSIEYFERAIRHDPSYAPAYAGLADAYALLGSVGTDDLLRPREAMPKAEAAALKAVQLDDSLAEGHASLAYAKMSYDWDWAGAEREFKRAMELNPGYATAHQWYAHYLLAMGLVNEALAEMKRARDVDPLSPVINVGVGWCLYQARRYDRAIDEYRKALEMNPGFALPHCTMGMAYEQRGSYKEAIEHYKTGFALSGGAIFASARLAHAYGASGNRHEAERILDELLRLSKQRYIPAVYVASIYEALGDDNHLMEWVEKAYQERSDYLIYLRTEPSFDKMRFDPRFIRVLRQVGLER